MTENNPWSSSASPQISRSPSVLSTCSSLPEYSVTSDSPPDYRTRQAIARATAELEALGHGDGPPVPSGAPGGGPNIRRAGIEAAQALRDIKTMLESLTVKLAGLGVDAKGYLTTLEMIKQGFRTVERASRELAIRIAQYGEKFDLVVIQFCADPKLSVERRVRKIEQFIHDAEEFQTKAYAIQDEFMELQKRFGRFVSTFSDWAKEREEANPVTIKRLCAEVEKLNARLKSQPWRAVTATAALCAAVFLGFTLANPCGIGLAALPAFKKLALAVGVPLAGFGWNAVETRRLTNAILTKQAEIKKLESEMEHIKATRAEPQIAASQNYTAFTDNLNVVSEMWQQVANDATAILQWLRDGANDADEPLYMKDSLNQGVARYKKMAEYLRDYANGVNL